MRLPTTLLALLLGACGGTGSDSSGTAPTTGASTGDPGTTETTSTLATPVEAELAADPRILECLIDGRQFAVVFPEQGEENTWGAVRLPHAQPVGRFHPETLSYAMLEADPVDEVTCSASLAHAVLVWTQDKSDRLPVPSEDAVRIDVPVLTTGETRRQVELDLKPYALEVRQDEYLHVAVQLTGSFVGSAGTVSCLESCFLEAGAEYDPGFALWVSTNTEAPYGFFDLHELNFLTNAGFAITVEGTYR